MEGLINIKKLGFEVIRMGNFDYEEFVRTGEQYLSKKYGAEVSSEQVKHSDIPHEISNAEKFIEVFGNESILPKLKDIHMLLSKGYLIICNVNYYKLYSKKGYAGHFVVVFKIDRNVIHFHDPGLPANPNAKIPLRQFVAAWEYPDKNSCTLQAFKLKKTSSK